MPTLKNAWILAEQEQGQPVAETPVEEAPVETPEQPPENPTSTESTSEESSQELPPPEVTPAKPKSKSK